MITYTNEINNLTVFLTEDLLFEIREFCIEKDNLETGGILVGIYDSDLQSAIITKVLGPPSDSKHSRASFIRGTKGVKKTLDCMWKEGQYYLGEWHFHPNGAPQPSGRDLSSLRSIAGSSKTQCSDPIMLIVGGTNSTLTCRIFLVNADGEYVEAAPTDSSSF